VPGTFGMLTPLGMVTTDEPDGRAKSEEGTLDENDLRVIEFPALLS